ncbi:MAG: (2Fe-2S)-binding protein [Spirochaetales bacterium]|nr:(2Fe-2S)-binding protein [Spirochaetales bacterium]
MAILTLQNTAQTFEISPGISILNTLLRNDIRIPHLCGGKMQCGTCRIKIISGRGFLSPLKPQEAERLAAVGAGQEERLACQTFAWGDVSISF